MSSPGSSTLLAVPVWRGGSTHHHQSLGWRRRPRLWDLPGEPYWQQTHGFLGRGSARLRPQPLSGAFCDWERLKAVLESMGAMAGVPGGGIWQSLIPLRCPSSALGFCWLVSPITRRGVVVGNRGTQGLDGNGKACDACPPKNVLALLFIEPWPEACRADQQGRLVLEAQAWCPS